MRGRLTTRGLDLGLPSSSSSLSLAHKGGIMKLLSMKIDDKDRAGVVIGEEVLDVTAFSEILERPGNEMAGRFSDALDLYLAGIGRLEEITSQIASDVALAGE